jgi:hypothetical protein
MTRNTRRIQSGPDDNGNAIVSVTLPKNKIVTLFKSDFDLLLSFGLSPIWHYNKDKGVVAWLKKWKRWGSLARLIADAGPDTNVLFKDGNKLNCKSDNLIVTAAKRGGTKLRYRDGIEPMYGWQRKVAFEPAS